MDKGTAEQAKKKYAFQIDLMDVSSLLRDVGVIAKAEQHKLGMVCIDIFSKKASRSSDEN